MNIVRSSWLSVALIVLIMVWLGIYGINKNVGVNSEPTNSTSDISTGDTKALAQCLTDKGFKLYGAYWCGHCKEQKDMFGEAVSLLNYVECSSPDGNSQTEACKAAGIELYPSWGFPDGTIVPGVMTLPDLAKASGCPTI
ncbi:MAG: hypothetical protein WC805_01045 [Patescibacteria group bacterium]|jgi:hypothetical protein